ncbi:MAG: hypothetical protein EOS70_23485 [Mesorhizobium sp.]|uniref:hypothetical protein n=1 Tax=Mesorhizobium sp. TaxID=1871066 RepID=UPI000FEA6C1C|nr:hypothetical protein [Mesorhizobium sp.]RWC29854.1 MAG: hypothetical protein EOS70_23485 [Mesorhizobium sp.]
MTITYRSVKASNLTAAEIDDNFHDLDDRIQAIEDNPPEPVNISNIIVVGTQMTIVLEDATEFGPFTLPQANFRPSVVSEIDANTDGTYDPVLGDANGYKRYSGSSDLTVMVPLNADVAFPVDTEITFRMAGSGAIIFETATAGPTLNGISGFLNQTSTQGATVTLKKVATNEWDIIGLLEEEA